MRGLIQVGVLFLLAAGCCSFAAGADEWTRQTTWNRHGWKNLLGQSPDESAAEPQRANDNPSFFEKMNNNTKEFFARTTGMFLRERNQSVIHPPKPKNGLLAKKAPKKKKSGWSGANEPGVPQTIDEFMKLKRPDESL